ncbi:MAG: thioredoxin family protein [Bacteroidota bacterium]
MFNKSKFYVLIFCLSINYGAFSQGVNWFKAGNLRTLFDQAKAQNKQVFIEVYSPECHICQAFKPTFSQKVVGDFFNKNYISYQLDVDSEEARGFLDKQKIWLPSIPTLLFFDKNVKLQHIAVMAENRNNAQVILEAGKVAQNSQMRTSNYKNRYLSGDRNPNFLIEHLLMSRYQKDTLANFEAAKAYFQTQKPNELTNATNLLVLEKGVMDMDSDFFNYLINNLPKFYAVKEKGKVNSIAENILMWSLYSSKGNKYNSAKIGKIKTYLSRVGIDAKSISGRIWMQESTAFFREKQAQKGIAVIEARVKGMKVSKEEGNFLCQFVKMKTTDKSALAAANKWCNL